MEKISNGYIGPNSQIQRHVDLMFQESYAVCQCRQSIALLISAARVVYTDVQYLV